MKSILLVITTLLLFAIPKVNLGQAPTLGTTSGFALFTAAGSFTSTGAAVVTGDVGTHVGAFTAFPPGTLVGTIHWLDPASTTAAADVATAYSDLSAIVGGSVIGTTLGVGQILTPGVYNTGAASTLDGDLTLNGGGNPNALFIIRIGGALSTGASSRVILTNSASLCNVYWQIGGQFDLGPGSVFRGTVISDGAINLLAGSSLLGRGLSTAGAISISDNVVTNPMVAAAGTITGTAAVCPGQTGITYSVPVINNASGYNWVLPSGATITAGANTNSITVNFSVIAVSGNITVQGTGSCGNGTVSPNFAVTVNPLPAAVAGADRSVCLNSATQLGTAAVAGSTYSWSSVPAGFTSTTSNPTVTPLLTTTYTVVETTTATGCSNNQSVVVTVNSSPAAVAGADRSICLNSATQLGAAAVAGSTYSWSSVPAGFTSTLANPTVTPLTNTTYTVVETITATGCINSHSVAVNLTPGTAAVAGADRTICMNSSTLIGAAAVAGSTYSWSSVPAGFTSTDANPTVSPLVTTTYTVVETITATGCMNSNSVKVYLNQYPQAIAGANRTICMDASTTLGAASVPGSTYRWRSIPAGFTSTVSNPIVSPKETTTYTVIETITATGCTNNNTVVVTVIPLPAAVAGDKRTICQNEETQIGATAVSGNSYSWSSVPAGFTSTVANPIVNPLLTTTYTVVETNTSAGCTNSHSVVVTTNPSPAAVAGADRSICINESTTLGAAAVTGSTYSWSSVPAGFTSTLANPTVTPLVTTTYTVVETNSSIKCTNKNSVTVTVYPLPAAVAGANRTICQNTETQIGAAAISGNSYSWSSVPAGFTSTEANPTVIPMVTTTYTVIETNTAAGCKNSHSVVVTINTSTAAVAGAARAICLNESTTLGAAAVAGSIYSWSSVPAGFTSRAANPTVKPLVSTTYTVIETNSSMVCSNSNSVVVTINPLPAANAGVARSICLNESTTIGATAITGSTYSWSSIPSGFTSTVANPSVSPMVTTIYTVTETITATGCVNNHPVVVTINPSPAAAAGAARSICMNSDTRIGAAAVPGSTYLWSSVPAGFTSTVANPTVSPMVTTTYTVVETNTAMNCINKNNVVVTVLPLPEAVAGANRAICLNTDTQIGAASVAGSTYSWSSSPAGFSSTAANPTVTPQVTTTYTLIEKTTATGCTNSHTVVVSLDASPAAVAGPDRTICLKESTSLGAAAVSGSTYSWSSVPVGFSSTLANPSVTPALTTTYTVVETFTATGCQKSNSVTVALNTPVDITAEPANQTACVGNPVSFSVTASGTDLTYQWRKGTVNLTNGGTISGATSATLTINPVNTTNVASNYNVVVTGACSSFDTSKNVSLIVNAAPGISTAVCAGSSVSFSAGATGAGLTYQWKKGDLILTDGGNIAGAKTSVLTINPVTSADASPNYSVEITGACSPNATSLSTSLVVLNAANIVSEPASQAACIGSTASFSVGATGTGLSYQWRKGTTNLINGGNISGATSATLNINPVNAADVALNYNVVITGPCSAKSTSKDAALSLCNTTGISSIEDGNSVKAVTIYPNPFTTSIDIRITDESPVNNYEMKIFNILGEEVVVTPLIKQLTTLKTSNLPTGVYLYQVNSGNKTIQSGKLISKQ